MTHSKDAVGAYRTGAEIEGLVTRRMAGCLKLEPGMYYSYDIYTRTVMQTKAPTADRMWYSYSTRAGFSKINIETLETVQTHCVDEVDAFCTGAEIEGLITLLKAGELEIEPGMYYFYNPHQRKLSQTKAPTSVKQWYTFNAVTGFTKAKPEFNNEPVPPTRYTNYYEVDTDQGIQCIQEIRCEEEEENLYTVRAQYKSRGNTRGFLHFFKLVPGENILEAAANEVIRFARKDKSGS